MSYRSIIGQIGMLKKLYKEHYKHLTVVEEKKLYLALGDLQSLCITARLREEGGDVRWE